MKNKYSFIDYNAPSDDQALLDTYSRTIAGVVGQVGEAVVHIQVAFGHTPVGTVDELHKKLDESVIGAVKLEVLRDGHKIVVNVIPGK